MAWIAGIVFIILLIAYPKQMIYLFLGIGLLVFLYIEDNKKKSKKLALEEEKVSISIIYNTSLCEEEYPLYITIKNTGDKIVYKTTWNIDVYREGYSGNLVEYSYSNYSTDKILTKNQSTSSCWSLPKMKTNNDYSKLIYSISGKYISFK